jgi:two-component system OmpR family response regulator
MRLFGWLSGGGIPADFDLRRCGWQLIDHDRTSPAAAVPLLAHIGSMEAVRWLELLGQARMRARVLLVGISHIAERARLLQLGFGDVLDDAPALAELDARAARIAALGEMMPRYRDLGRLRLDLFHRDGIVGGRPLGLHPREFALLWRLSDTPGVPVGRDALLSEVWRLFHPPETNRVAVHVFRLRAKLAIAGLEGMVQTAPGGGYFFAAEPAVPFFGKPFMLGGEALDESHVLGDERSVTSDWDQRHES